MPKVRNKGMDTAGRDLLDLLIPAAGLDANLLTYVVRCRRQGDSWRTMAAELTAKLGRNVGDQWLRRNGDGPEAEAAYQAFTAERAARMIPGGAE